MVRTRFAPSPTGYLHIGGVRTALFNWLFARKHGGQFILRIDDTDQQRNVAEALQPILDGFRWLGIDWDEGPEVDGPHAPYFQSQRVARYQQAVQQLIAAGAAYYDYATPEELQAEREAAEQQKQPFVYSRRWMAETDAQRAAFEAEGRQAVVRLKMPREGELELDDLIRGPRALRLAAGTRSRNSAHRRQLSVPFGDRRGRLRFRNLARNSCRGTPVEHTPPSVHRPVAGLHGTATLHTSPTSPNPAAGRS